MAKISAIHELSHAILKNHDCDLLTDQTRGHLGIYQKHYILNLVESLQSKFIATVKLLGEGNFKFFAKGYVLSTPSESPNIDDYGKSLPEFLGEQIELANIGYIKDLAKLDWFYFVAHENGEFVVLPKGILEVWDLLAHDKKARPVEVSGVSEKIIFHLSPSGVSMTSEEI